MCFSLPAEKCIFGMVSLQQFLVAGGPDAIEESGCQTINCEYFARTVAKIDKNEHLLLCLYNYYV